MDIGRGMLAACAVEGIVYAIGGALNKFQTTAAVEAYNPATGQWLPKAPMPQARSFATAQVVNGIIYVFHGNDVFAYDPKTNIWTTKASHFYPYSWGLMSAEVDGIIYLFGGMVQSYPWPDAHDFTLAYNPTNDQFTVRRKMPRKRITSGCGVIEGKVYLVAGASKEPVVNPDAVLYTSMDIFDPQGGVTPHIRSGALESANSFRLAWDGEAGISYAVESSTNPGPPWVQMMLPSGATITATGAVVETTCTVPTGEQQRFFRVCEAN